MKQDTIVIHRGRNKKTSGEFLKVSTRDYNFDFRGFHGGSRLNPLWLLAKAWITSKEIPEAKNYLIDGGMLFWVGFFLKRRYPLSRLYLFVPEPAFYLDPRKGFFQRVFFNYKIKSIAKHTDNILAISPMVAEDARRLLGNKINIDVIKFPMPEVEVTTTSRRPQDLLFVAERPAETGYVKGLKEALEIHEKLVKSHPTLKLHLAGKGTETLTEPQKNIVGLGQVDIKEAFEKARILIAPAKYDAFPIVVPEAIMAGMLPVVSTKVGTKYFLQPYTNLILKRESIDEWCKVLSEVLSLDDKGFQQMLSKLQANIVAYIENVEIKEIKDHFC